MDNDTELKKENEKLKKQIAELEEEVSAAWWEGYYAGGGYNSTSD